MSFWKPAWKPTHEERLSLILPDCEGLRDRLLKWGKNNFVIAYCPQELIIYLFVEGDLGFNVEGVKFFGVATSNNCGPIDILTFGPLLDKIVVCDVRNP